MLDALLVGLLLFGVFPVWLIAGFADYCFHRMTRIEQTTGLAESWLHVAQYLQIVVGVGLALVFEITSLVLLVVVILTALHVVTGYVDVSYATGRRYISPPEQHVHSYMETLPVIAATLLVLLHWSQFAALFNDEAASWVLTRRQPPLPAAELAAVGIGMALAGLAIAEEVVRCARRRQGA
jgi:hypothetical protein